MSSKYTVTFAYKWGQSVAFDLVVESGTVPANTSVACDLKLAENGDQVPEQSEEVAIPNVTTTFVAAVGEEKAYWRCSLTPEQVKTLDQELYFTDVRISFDDTGEVYYPDPLGIDLSRVVTDRDAT